MASRSSDFCLSRLLVISSLAAAVCVALRPLLSFDQIPIFRDLLLFIVPIKHFLGDHLRRGEIPLWNPWVCLGSPFVAAMHTAVFYPPSALLLLDLPLGFNLFLLVHYLAALLGMWRLLTEERGFGWMSAAMGSLTFAVGGYMISLLNIPKELHGAAWLPWALLFWMRWLRSESPRDLALTAVAIALQILGGSVESMLMTVALLAAFALHARAPSSAGVLGASAGLAIVVVLAIALTAFQLLPTLEYSLQSGRGAGFSADQVFHWSLQPVSLLQLILPVSGLDVPGLGVGLERDPPMLESLYLGVPALCLAFAGAMGGYERPFWALVLLGALLMALGSATPLLPLLYREAPALLGRIRYPEKFLLLFHTAAAVLAAEGLARLEVEGRACLAAVIVGALLCIAAVGVWWLVEHDPQPYLAILSTIAGRGPTAIVPVAEALAARAGRLAALAGSVAGVLVLARRALVGQTFACVALVLLQATDLMTIRWRTLATTSWHDV
jgi:hypothetical protein